MRRPACLDRHRPRRCPRHRPRRRLRTAAASALLPALLAVAAGAAPTGAAAASHALDRAALAEDLRAVHRAGVYGVFASVRDGAARWDGAAGFADRDTGRPVRADLRHRVGSTTKSFTAVAVLQQNAAGRVDLDRPVGAYLPELVPGERGRKVTVRMLLNHTSGIADFLPDAFPSLRQNSPASLDAERYRTVAPARLVAYGVGRPQLFEPGTDWSYSNTNYVVLGELLRAVTGRDPEQVITEDVIRRAGLRDTYFPGTDPRIKGPHPRMYDAFFGRNDPPRDYSVYNMTWAGTAAALVSTAQDLDTFYRALLRGALLPAAQLDHMRATRPVEAPDGTVVLRYGLGLYSVDTPCGPAWGHDGLVWGAGTLALSSPDGSRQIALGLNLTKYHRLDEATGRPLPHPADAALEELRDRALCGAAPTGPAAGRAWSAPGPVTAGPVSARYGRPGAGRCRPGGRRPGRPR
ncbi:serine hydrolase domain-containing protein [Streptomyces antimicrobicus]|uniref:Beta-lactamase family protein n=1 Tax=Streptomyces antimicrobicus TaxID=2883108 RepID=A0ABS8B3U2_9ACTN|nr:serine hydrolase domain-containing protein [Streptomyces antimicrobicus]MCB5179290.1 beta-lactamase family protein [Streptomyces antimicrobicus]